MGSKQSVLQIKMSDAGERGFWSTFTSYWGNRAIKVWMKAVREIEGQGWETLLSHWALGLMFWETHVSLYRSHCG